MSAQRPSARAISTAAGGAPRLEPSGLRLGRELLPLRCGAVHYFRIQRTHWRRALESVRGLGLPIVETYVPWGLHELPDGRFDFGEQNPQHDLGAFLDLAHELGLRVFLRPGPNVNAELALFGLPRRVVFEPRNQARSPRGRPLPFIAPPRMFPAPSYASRNFREEIGKWFGQVAEIVAPRCHPRGPVVLLQVDNETAFFFRDGPYDSDYHPEAIADFSQFLTRRYGSIAELNSVYQTAYEQFDAVPAPQRFRATHKHELPPFLDWMAFHEWLLSDALTGMAQQLRAAGLDLPMVHNLPMGEGGLPTSISTLERSLDLCGLDYYHGQSGLGATRHRTLRLCGSSKLAFAPELGVGAPPWFGARSERDAFECALTACAYGLRGFNLYMAVDRDRWFGAPIDEQGEPRPLYERWRRFIGALRSVGFHRLRREVRVAVCLPKEYAQLTRATHTLGALSTSLLDLAGIGASAACRSDRFEFKQPIQLAWQALVSRLDEALCAEQVPFVFVESDADFEATGELAAVIAPSYEFADPQRWARLQRFAARGGTVLWGPELPSLDVRMQPCSFEAIGPGPFEADDLTEARRMVRALADRIGLARPIQVEPWPVQATVHADEHGARVVFLMHPGGEDDEAEVHLGAPLRLRDALSGERFAGVESLLVPMAAQSCRMLLVERPGDAE